MPGFTGISDDNAGIKRTHSLLADDVPGVSAASPLFSTGVHSRRVRLNSGNTESDKDEEQLVSSSFCLSFTHILAFFFWPMLLNAFLYVFKFTGSLCSQTFQFHLQLTS